MKFLKIIIVTFFLASPLFFTNKASAQCAMCQATVESNSQAGGTQANGLNNGIMYLLAAPYLAIAGIGLLWYKKYRKKDVSIDIRQEKINLN